ncbi:hypothetical protein [Candidatus Regiella insecticola]|uniref:hypothetical protein n=1 Tax=Candidatus Regiella insecticola TaxID=138073 RepID=UPI00030C5F0E|nr:hypothetical protein [Candidatus Regiella insecticola]
MIYAAAPLNINRVKTLTIQTKAKIKKDKTGKSKKTKYKIIYKLKRLFQKIQVFFSYNEKERKAKKEIYKLYLAESKYIDGMQSDNITDKKFNALIHSIHTIKSLLSPGHKDKIYLSYDSENNIVVNIDDEEKITLPNIHKEKSSTDEITNDERKENITRLFPLSSTKEEGSLPEKKLDDLQYIYTTSKNNGETKEKKTIEENENFFNEGQNEKKRREYFAKECEAEIDQMSLDNTRDGNKNQHIYINGKYHKPLNWFRGNEKDIHYDKKRREHIEQSEIFKSITTIEKITPQQVSVLIGHLCQTSANLTVGTFFNSGDKNFHKEIKKSNETLTYYFQQCSKVTDHKHVNDPEITMINIKQQDADLLLTHSSCVTPFCQFSEDSSDDAIKAGDKYYYPFNISLNYVIRIDSEGKETFEKVSISFIPAKNNGLIPDNQLKDILLKYDEKAEKEFIVNMINENIESSKEFLEQAMTRRSNRNKG